MNPIQAPVTKDLVLVGGGHSHVGVLKGFGTKPMPGVRLTLITRDVHTPYSGMLPGLIAGHYEYDETHIDLGPLSRFAGARLYHDEAVGLDLDSKRILCRSRPPVPYDLVSINIGSTPTLDPVPGAAESVVPVKPIGNFLRRWAELRQRVLGRSGSTRIGVVGAGAGGVELLLSARHALEMLRRESGRPRQPPDFHLFFESATILPTHNRWVRSKFQRVLRRRGIRLYPGLRVVRVRGRTLVLEDGSSHEMDEILWVTRASAPGWLRESKLEVDAHGFVKVEATLESTSHPGVFAAGDVAAVAAHPREKAGVFAVRQGKPLERNLRRTLRGLPPKPFHPQRKFLSLISTGDRRAVASRGSWSLEGRWVWHWKDRIDRRFMARFNDLSKNHAAPAAAPGRGVMETPAAPAGDRLMRCRGCGSKVGAAVLERVLGRIDPGNLPDVVLGLEAGEDAAALSVPPGQTLLQSVDMFPAIVDDPYIFGRIAANHCLSDIYAMGGRPRTALAIAALPWASEDKMEVTLEELLQGARQVLRRAGAELVGGHTLEGSELALGLAVSGLADSGRLLRKGAMEPGDRLVLTKPLGTGALFAAEMRLKAKGRWIQGAVECMLRSNRRAAACFLRHAVHACTDVSGFGLVGHLFEMVRDSDVQVRLSLPAVPLLEGAAETAGAGIHSSLQPRNLRLQGAVRNPRLASRAPAFPLLFDPQTAGGLLASVPAHCSEACVEELRSGGDSEAAVIGAVEVKEDGREPITIDP